MGRDGRQGQWGRGRDRETDRTCNFRPLPRRQPSPLLNQGAETEYRSLSRKPTHWFKPRAKIFQYQLLQTSNNFQHIFIVQVSNNIKHMPSPAWGIHLVQKQPRWKTFEVTWPSHRGEPAPRLVIPCGLSPRSARRRGSFAIIEAQFRFLEIMFNNQLEHTNLVCVNLIWVVLAKGKQCMGDDDLILTWRQGLF